MLLTVPMYVGWEKRRWFTQIVFPPWVPTTKMSRHKKMWWPRSVAPVRNIRTFIWKYDRCCTFIEEIIHPFIGTINLNTLPKKRDIEGVFGCIFTIHRVVRTTFSFVRQNPTHTKLVRPPQKNHCRFSTVLLSAQPTLSDHVKMQPHRNGFDVFTRPTPGASAEGVDQLRCGWVVTNNVDQLIKNLGELFINT